MDKTILDIQEKIITELNQIDFQYSDSLKKSECSIEVLKKFLNELKNFVVTYLFDNQADEIHFFKEIKPSIYSKLIYFVEIFNLQSRRPTGSISVQKKYFQKELKKMESFFFENLEFYQYYRNKMTYLDDKYFVRGKLDIRLYSDPFVYDTDPGFSTGHDYKVARIMANDLLSVYLNSELASQIFKFS